MVGGHFDVESVAGKGTTITAQFSTGKTARGGKSLMESAETKLKSP
jgi:hypothetical protein